MWSLSALVVTIFISDIYSRSNRKLYFVFLLSTALLFLIPVRKKATIHQEPTMLATSENVLFSGHNHLLTTGTDDQDFGYLPSASEGDN